MELPSSEITLRAGFFEQLFGTPAGGAPAADPLSKSILDDVIADYQSVVVQGSGLSNGAAHNFVDLPILMLGSLAGRLKTGRLVRGADREYNDVILTVLHAFGFREQTFGNPAHCAGPFSELL